VWADVYAGDCLTPGAIRACEWSYFSDGSDYVFNSLMSADVLVDVLSAVDVKPILEGESAVNGEDVEDSKQVFIAFARVFSGVVRRGQTLYVLGPKHDPCKVPDSVSLLTVNEFYYDARRVCLSVYLSALCSAFPVKWSQTLIAAFESLGLRYMPPPCPLLPPTGSLRGGG